MVVNTEHKRTVVIDVAIPADGNIQRKVHEEMKKYQMLEEQLEQVWKVKSTVVPGVMGSVTHKLGEWHQQIPGTTCEGCVQGERCKQDAVQSSRLEEEIVKDKVDKYTT